MPTPLEVGAVGSTFLSPGAPARRLRRLRGLALLTSFGLAAWIVAAAWRPRADALEPPPRAPQPSAEPVGAVDHDDLLKANANHDNWLMYGRTYDGHRY